MTVTMISIANTDFGAYCTIAEARSRAVSLASMPGMDTLVASDDQALSALLFAATLDIDAAMPWQGVQYDQAQDREFPRYTSSIASPLLIWDWDEDAEAAVVPQTVKDACILQAAHILNNPEQAARLDAIRSGLASQSIGSLSESYLKPTDLPGGLSNLSSRAEQLLDRYRLRTGGLR